MANLSNMTVEVKAKLGVDRRTAETCLRLVEIFCNENNVNIIGHHKENGEVEFSFEPGSLNINVSPEAFAAINAIGRDSHSKEL